jgi:hypothetical protein
VFVTISTRQKFEYGKHIAQCLAELAQLSKKPPTENALSSLDAIAVVRQASLHLKDKPRRRFTIKFEERLTERFTTYVERLYRNNPSPVYIWTHLSNSCGLYEIPSILDFNFGFSYDVNRDGIIALLTKDVADKMTLDFSEGSLGTRVLEVEVAGDNWPLVVY